MQFLEFAFFIVWMAPRLSVKIAILQNFFEIPKSMAFSRAVGVETFY